GNHARTLASLDNLAALYRFRGQLDRAEQLLRRNLDGCRKTLGDNHPDTIGTMQSLGVVLQGQGRYAEAEPLLDQALARRRVIGEDLPLTLATMANLASIRESLRQLDRAEALRREVLERTRKRFGASSPPAADALDRLGECLLKQQRAAEAE